eukprot:TRINITY_DN6976_c0_g2_i2.p1 TRINITY_DN6976_c0_g2~~TRINITY_DN6976_c0_g2_i2.p1  ORF type:complete len:234 (-),score=30.49 TRINITY_DN6976_c0_g2_i2:99-800(-)
MCIRDSFITDGTVIGWARDRAFVPWDGDVDVGYWAEDMLQILTIFSKQNSSRFDRQFERCALLPNRALLLFTGWEKPKWSPGWATSDEAIALNLRNDAAFLRLYTVFDDQAPDWNTQCYMDIEPWTKATTATGLPARYSQSAGHIRVFPEELVLPTKPCEIEGVTTRCPANVTHMLIDRYGQEWWRAPYTRYDKDKGRWVNDTKAHAALQHSAASEPSLSWVVGICLLLGMLR